ncbi:MAG: VWA domain-containing protein [Acidobacteria bacterium]|nr:VWA domain-containing protein [Acidobacteriota bacterium]
MRVEFIISFIFSFLVAGVAVAAGLEQRPGEQRPETLIRLDTELVQIDVVVEDEKGRLVRDLRREDFQLIEDGRPQSLSYFSVATAGRAGRSPITTSRSDTALSAGSVDTAPIDLERYFILAIDDLHLSPGSLQLAKQSLQRFIDQQLSPTDEASLITTSGMPGQYQQFTRERDLLRRAVSRLSVRERVAGSVTDTPRITPYQAELIDSNDSESLELAVQETMQMLRIDRRMATGMAQGRARQIVAENNSVTIATLSTLENVIRSLKSLPGRKVMILISDGFLLGGLRESRHYDVRRITDAATRAGVVIYSLDARGLVALPGEMDASQPGGASMILPGVRSRIANGSIQAQRDGIYALAADTGGRAIFNNNDINLGLQRVLDDTETCYLLAFEPTTSYRDGRYRKLEVRLPGHPKYKVRTRKGYFSPDEKQLAKAEREQEKMLEAAQRSEKEAGRLRDMQIRNGLSALLPVRDIAIGLTAGYLDTRDEGTSIDLSAHIDINGIALRNEGERMRSRLELISLIFDESGRTVDNRSEKMELNLRSESLAEARRNGLGYRRLLKLKPGSYQVRLILREEESLRIGTANAWIEIPDISRRQLALSSIFLSVSDAKAGSAAAPTATNGTTSDARSLVYRRFPRRDNLDFLIFAYNAKIGENGLPDAAIQTQLHSGNKLIYASPLRGFFNSDKRDEIDPARLPYQGRLDLSAFEPGTYELRVVVIDRTARSTVKRSINFEIEK